jgi:hypothetical protein
LTDFFFDRDIGTAVPRALQIVRQAYEDVHYHDELFDADTEDVDWIADVGGRGWIVVTRNRKIGTNPAEIAAVEEAGLRCFCLTQTRGHQLDRWRMLERVVCSWADMQAEVRTRPAPFFIGIGRGGAFKVIL